PSVVRMVPTTYTTNVPVNVVVDVEFSEALDASSVVAQNVELLEGASEVARTVSRVGSGEVVRITPSSDLAANSFYGVRLSTELKDLEGLSPATNYNGYFTTGAGSDATVPSVVMVSPPAGSTGVGVNAPIRVKFSKGVNPLTVDATTVVVTGGAQTVVPSSVVFNDANDVVEIVPHEPLVAQAAYTITVGGVRDLVGHTVAPFTAGFTTAPGPDTDPPAIISSSVANLGSGTVPQNAVLVVEMSERIDPVSAGANGFYLFQ